MQSAYVTLPTALRHTGAEAALYQFDDLPCDSDQLGLSWIVPEVS